MANPTIDDVARAAGVSIKTVSRVVNNEANVREQTRLRVQQTIDELGYRPNLSARSLATRRSYLIALLYDNFLAASAYIVNLQCGAIEQCQHQGYELLIHPVNVQAKDYRERIERFVKTSGVDGLLLTPPLSDDPALIDLLTSTGKPFVLISPAAPDPATPCVITDDRPIAAEMTRHLLSLGHTRINFIAGRPDHLAVGLRYLGYQDAMQAAGLPCHRQQGHSSFASGVATARELLNQPERPTAIFAGNDDMAAGVLSVAHELGIRVPEHLSIVGFDDLDQARYCWPALTTVRQPVAEMAGLAASRLLDNLKNRHTDCSHQLLPSKVMLRGSSALAATATANALDG